MALDHHVHCCTSTTLAQCNRLFKACTDLISAYFQLWRVHDVGFVALHLAIAASLRSSEEPSVALNRLYMHELVGCATCE